MTVDGSIGTPQDYRREIGVNARVRKDKPAVYANVGVHDDVEITLAVDGYGASIHFGHDGPELSVDFADVESLERLAVVAADGVRQIREGNAGH